MRRSQAFLFLAFYLIFGTLAVLTANGQIPPPTPAPPLPPDPLQANVESTEGRSEAVPSGTASQVSDWALAGLVWSDACLAQKVMKKATRDAVDETQKAQYELLLSETDAIVAKLEQFGWRKVARPVVAARPSLPNSPAAGQPSLAKPGPRGITRIDTETPAGFDDPGLDDERTMDDSRLNINRYRVDDFVDETIREQDNVADALEDGVEEAIAAHRSASSPSTLW